jgi:hypothetical protein
MTSLGEFCTAGTIRCNKIIATTADLPSGGGGGGGDIDVDSITFDNKWKIYLDANSDFIIKNEAQNVISLSGDAHTGKVTLHDFNLDDLANVDTSIKEFGSFMYYESIQQKYEFTNKVRFLGTSLDVSSIPIVTSAGDLRLFNDDTSANIFLGGYTRHNPTLNGASIGIGYQACDASNRSFNVGIGYQAGKIEQGIGFPFQGQSVAIGYQAGESFQKVHAISLGAYAGRINQGESSLACGFFCGNNAQGNYAVGLGNACAQSLQGDFAVALGASSGNIHQGIESLACGSFSGHTNLGYQSVALGHRASYDGGDSSNTIVINATGSDLDPEGTDRTYIKPIREVLNNEFLCYNNISGEVTRSAEVNFTSNFLLNGVTGALNEVVTGDGAGGVFWNTPAAPPPSSYAVLSLIGSYQVTGTASKIIDIFTMIAAPPALGITLSAPTADTIQFSQIGTYLINYQFVCQETGGSYGYVTASLDMLASTGQSFLVQNWWNVYRTYTGSWVLTTTNTSTTIQFRFSNPTNTLTINTGTSQNQVSIIRLF